MVKHDCRFLVLDNLAALMGDSLNYDSASQKVLDWIASLQAMDVCVLVVLHKADKKAVHSRDNSAGSTLFKKRARVVINLYGK